jgi:hypothetical protein
MKRLTPALEDRECRHAPAEEHFVHEIRDGIELFFNRSTTLPDGWWWGPDDKPFLHGPFVSSQAAVDDAIAKIKPPVKVWTMTKANLDDDPPSFDGTWLTVIDTGGKIWVRTGEVRAGGQRHGR